MVLETDLRCNWHQRHPRETPILNKNGTTKHRGNTGSMNGLEEVGLVPIAPAVHAHLVWLKPNRKGIRAFRSIHAWMHQDDDMKVRFNLRQPTIEGGAT